jgi:hypothetical protein
MPYPQLFKKLTKYFDSKPAKIYASFTFNYLHSFLNDYERQQISYTVDDVRKIVELDLHITIDPIFLRMVETVLEKLKGI